MADTETTEQVTARTAAAYTAGGTQRDAVTLPTDLFDGTINFPVMHHAVKAYLANQRQGNASTKTRGVVTGGNQKPWKQKGTGRARQGSTRAPHWVGGGTTFGPSTRDYTMGTNKKVKVLVPPRIRCSLSTGLTMTRQRRRSSLVCSSRLASTAARFSS
jgi:large subunit ribosomal protein L4